VTHLWALEQKRVIRFHLVVYGEQAMKKTQVFYWVKEIRRGRDGLSDYPCVYSGVRYAKSCDLAGFTEYPCVYSGFLESLLVFIECDRCLYSFLPFVSRKVSTMVKCQIFGGNIEMQKYQLYALL
jgi:hypothetical protein